MTGINIKTYGSLSEPTLDKKTESDIEAPMAIPAWRIAPSRVNSNTFDHSLLCTRNNLPNHSIIMIHPWR